MKKNGFTLMELMLTVIVIAILVSIAIPNYITTVERARSREAIATLESMRAAEQTYASERRTMIALTGPGTPLPWTLVGLEDPHLNNRRSWNYTFNVGGTGTAVRNGGPYNGWTFTLDNAGNLVDAGGGP